MSKSHLAVTRQHDTEPFTNSVQNIGLPHAPQLDFSKFFDGESVDDQDLVVWFNLGMHPFTRADDVPVTLFTGAYSSIVFAPQNFLDRAQDGDLTSSRWVTPFSDGTLAYEDYGVELPICELHLDEPVLAIDPIVGM